MSSAIIPQRNNGTRKRPNDNRVWFWANECKYEVILDKVKALGWKAVDDEKNESKCNMYWVDISAIHDRMKTLQPWQMINHFPGMPNIARKNRMGQNLNRMLKIFPKEYNFYPRTWVLPGELNDFRSQFDSQGNSLGNKIYIIKPDAGCQGRGIFLCRNWDVVPQQEAVVAQLYIKRPLLLDGFKFDLRIYVLVTCIRPLRVYLFQDGLVRMCTEEYVKPTKQNLSMMCMHLTNYAVNKKNANFQQPSAKSTDDQQDEGSKRSLHWFMNWVRNQHGTQKADWLWKRMGTVIMRTLLSIMPTLSREYDLYFKDFGLVPLASPTSPAVTEDEDAAPGSTAAAGEGAEGLGTGASQGVGSSEGEGKEGAEGLSEGGSDKEKATQSTMFRGSRCFEVLGYDIMLDSRLRPWVIEVNHLPSFGTDSPLDADIKSRLMEEVFNVLPVRPDDEAAYLAHHKAEAEKRLTIDRTVASQAKLREKAVTERDREKEREEERKRERERLRVRREARLRADAQAAAAKAAMEERRRQRAAARLEVIRQRLVEIYLVHSVDKVSKVDKLLERYQGREEEFLQFVLQKYGLEPEPYVEPEDEDEEAVQGQQTESGGAAESEPEPSGSENKEGEKEGDQEQQDKEQEDKDVQRGRPKSEVYKDKESAMRGRFSRSLSPQQQGKRIVASWKSSAEEEAAFREEVLRQHVPAPNDPWMLFELSHLPSFTRIFPSSQSDSSFASSAEPDSSAAAKLISPVAKSPKLDSKDTKAEKERREKEEEEDNDDDDDDGSEDGDDSKLNRDKPSSALGNGTSSGRTKLATFEDILVSTFVQDRRQTMRLSVPRLREVEKEKERERDLSLPPLPDERRKGSDKDLVPAQSKASAGWRAPPKHDSRDVAPKVVTQSQVDAAQRLSKGLSAVPSSKDRSPSIVGSAARNSMLTNVVYSQESLLSSGTGILSAAGYDVASLVGQQSSSQLQGRSKSTGRQLVQQPTVLRQQVFAFDAFAEGGGGAGPPPQGPPTQVPAMLSAATFGTNLAMSSGPAVAARGGEATRKNSGRGFLYSFENN